MNIGDKVKTNDGDIGVIKHIEDYSHFKRYGVKFKRIPEKYKCLRQEFLYYEFDELKIIDIKHLTNNRI